jgi:cytochrome c oxidase cbb3-type subunit 3
MTVPRLLLGLTLTLALAACEREARPFENVGAATGPVRQVAASPLVAGAAAQATPQTSPYQENAWGIAEGKRLYEQFNCVGCHAHGGGGMGPPLMDDAWIYGSHPANIFETIVDGRPNGMPAFRPRLPEAQIWQIVAYVQSMSGQAPIASMPGRSDHLAPGVPENQRPAEIPVQTGTP